MAKKLILCEIGSVHQRCACSDCFTFVDSGAGYCPACGVELDENAYSFDDLAATRSDTPQEKEVEV